VPKLRLPRTWEPKFIEYSMVPVYLSRISPIEIGAISLCGLVFSRGGIDENTRRHEAIHFQQQLELLFVAFFILYFVFWLGGMLIHRFDGEKAYYNNPFEKEAFKNDTDPEYLKTTRKRFAWVHYI